MNAIEFVKEHGINEAKRIVSTYPNHTHVTNDARMFINSEVYKKSVPHFADSVDVMVKINNLKQIVEAWELVFEHGSIDLAKKYADSPYTAPEIKLVLGKAINLVEQCQ